MQKPLSLQLRIQLLHLRCAYSLSENAETTFSPNLMRTQPLRRSKKEGFGGGFQTWIGFAEGKTKNDSMKFETFFYSMENILEPA